MMKSKNINYSATRGISNAWMWQEPRQKKGEYQPQKYDYLLVLDFEATCGNKGYEPKPQEIIEFPCAMISTKKNFEIVSIFHEYIRPIHNPTLTTFCTELTGITQDMVAKETDFASVFSKFTKWLEDNNLKSISPHNYNFTYVTCGDWDLNYMLPAQCNISKIHVPGHLQHWINVKKAFARSKKGNYPRTLSQMLNELNMTFEGRQHSGIDDVLNIVRIVQALAKERHCIFENTN